MKTIAIDTEGIGLHGPSVLIQYSEEGQKPILHHVFNSPVRDTLKLIEELADCAWLGYNLPFDSFHINQVYNILRFMDLNWYPAQHLREMAALERKAAREAVCVKPPSALDLMCYARRGPYQTTMDRKAVYIRRVPKVLAADLAILLDEKVPLKDLYFARLSNPKRRWTAKEVLDEEGNPHPDFVDLCLEFAPVSALKALLEDALGIKPDHFSDLGLEDKDFPDEYGFAPYADLCSPSWVDVANKFIDFWAFNERGRAYAAADATNLHHLRHFFSSQAAGNTDEQARQDGLTLSATNLIPVGDQDSILSCMVGAVRWRGFAIDSERIKKLCRDSKIKQAQSPYNLNSPETARRFLQQVMSPMEIEAIKKDGKFETGKEVLEAISKQCEGVPCDCLGEGCGKCTDGIVPLLEKVICDKCGGKGCTICEDTGIVEQAVKTKAALRALQIMEYRSNDKEIGLFEKLLMADRFHVSTKVIGALSGRMSGADGLNPQGINRDKEIRECFPLADEGYILGGGDFAGFEVVLAQAVYNDPQLRIELTTKKPCMKCMKNLPLKQIIKNREITWIPGQPQPELPDFKIKSSCDECKGTGWEALKIHALFGQHLFSPLTPDGVYMTKGLKGEQDKYTKSKIGVFLLLYGGEAYTMVNKVGVTQAVAEVAAEKWMQDHPVWKAARDKIYDSFCSMRQPDGLGSRVFWKEPADYIETMDGFRRYFTLENNICRALFEIAETPPKWWSQYKDKVKRRDREQFVGGAIRSALYGAAFGLQAACMRAAGNHVIQGSGAYLTKKLQTEIWSIQPSGVSKFFVIPFQVHDEIMNPHLPEVHDEITRIVEQFVARERERVPLLEIDWGDTLNTWADK